MSDESTGDRRRRPPATVFPGAPGLRLCRLAFAACVVAYLAWNYGMVALCVWAATGGWMHPLDIGLIVLAYVSLPIGTVLLLLRRRGAVLVMVLAGLFAIGACGRPARPAPDDEVGAASNRRYEFDERLRMSAELALAACGAAMAWRQAPRHAGVPD